MEQMFKKNSPPNHGPESGAAQAKRRKGEHTRVRSPFSQSAPMIQKLRFKVATMEWEKVGPVAV
jgi:hypothetical protein